MHDRSQGEHFSHVMLAGVGVVGKAIAEAHLRSGVAVWLLDNDREKLQTVLDLLRSQGYHSNTVAEFPTGGFVAFVTDDRVREFPPPWWETLCHSSDQRSPKVLIIESIVERLDAKKSLAEQMFAKFGESIVFASNTSSLRIADIASGLAIPESVCGLHFFMPVHGRDLVELISAPSTDAAILDTVAQHAHAIGKPPLRVKDSPGFVVNRLLWPYLNRSVKLLELGASHIAIRQAAIQLGFPMSPLELMDLIGLRTAFDAGRVAWAAFPQRLEPSPILPGLVKKKALGRQSKVGFYDYATPESLPNSPHQLSTIAQQVIESYQREVREWSNDEVHHELLEATVIEAQLVLEEHIVNRVQDVVIALQHGLGVNPNGTLVMALQRDA